MKDNTPKKRMLVIRDGEKLYSLSRKAWRLYLMSHISDDEHGKSSRDVCSHGRMVAEAAIDVTDLTKERAFALLQVELDT